MRIRRDARSGNATETLLHLRLEPVVARVSARCWEAGAAQVSVLLLDWVVRRCIHISCATGIIATKQRYRGRCSFKGWLMRHPLACQWSKHR